MRVRLLRGERRVRPPLGDFEADVFHDAYTMRPEQFKNVTNGVDHRRWLSQINPKLDALVKECTGGDDYLLHPRPSAAWRSTRTTRASSPSWRPSEGEQAPLCAYVARESVWC